MHREFETKGKQLKTLNKHLVQVRSLQQSSSPHCSCKAKCNESREKHSAKVCTSRASCSFSERGWVHITILEASERECRYYRLIMDVFTTILGTAADTERPEIPWRHQRLWNESWENKVIRAHRQCLRFLLVQHDSKVLDILKIEPRLTSRFFEEWQSLIHARYVSVGLDGVFEVIRHCYQDFCNFWRIPIRQCLRQGEANANDSQLPHFAIAPDQLCANHFDAMTNFIARKVHRCICHLSVLVQHQQGNKLRSGLEAGGMAMTVNEYNPGTIV